MSLLPSYFFFVRTTWRNRALQFGRRIRSPRYAIALVLGITYFFFAFGGPNLFTDGGHRSSGGALIRLADTVGPLILLLLAGLWWFHSTMGQALNFTPAEANLLVPAPLTRRQLIQFKLLNAVPGTLLTALMFTLISRGAPLPAIPRFVSLVVLFGTLRLHQIAATLVRGSLAQQGRAGLRKAGPATLVFAAIIAAVAYTLFLARDAITASPDAGAAVRAVSEALSRVPASIAMAPFTAVLAPVAAKSLAGWPVPFAIAIAILLAHYVWVLRMDTAFEEGAVEAGAAIAAKVEAIRQGRRVTLGSPKKKTVRAPWFALPSEGEPVYAIWWKNVLQITRGTSRFMLVLAFIVPAFLVFLDKGSGDAHGAALAGALSLAMFGMLATLMGPLHMRNDLRGDLRRIELLRTLPVGGGRLVAAEVAASTLTLTAIQLVMFAVAAGLAAYAGRLAPSPLELAAVIPLVLLLVAVNGTMVLIHNGFALLFPAWANLRRGTQGPGVENFGQNILIMVGTFLLFALSFVGPLLVAAAAGGAMAFKMGAWAAIPAAIVFLVALYLQAAGIIAWLGRVYDRIDPVEAGLCD